MTAAKNIILDKDGTNELTVYTTTVEELQSKNLIVIAFPQSKANWASGPKTVKHVDLLRITQRFNIDGIILSSDREKFKNLMNQGGVFAFDYNGDSFTVNFEKFSIKQRPEDDTENVQPDNYDVKFSVVVGENI